MYLRISSKICFPLKLCFVLILRPFKILTKYTIDKDCYAKYCCILVVSLPLLMHTCKQGSLSCIHGVNVPTQCPVFTALSVGGVYLQDALS